MDYSFVIPAYNEERRVARCIESIQESMQALPREYEIIVADDASDDDTAKIAERLGARVVASGKRNIGATRNVGAKAANGETLIFVDADSFISPQTVVQMGRALEEGAIGGGATIEWSSRAGFFANLCLIGWNTASRLFHMPAGSFFFVHKRAFEQAGGFDETYFATEELHLGKELKRLGRLTVVKAPIQTSPRKVHEFSGWEIAKMLFAISLSPGRTLKNRDKLHVWYERRNKSSQ
ncbi:MAG: glycosyltransferase [Candidatus Hinthialibacter antarcticus]|nr:glycosyltransferase [Candidatus Hinthialibacter antarcticus]